MVATPSCQSPAQSKPRPSSTLAPAVAGRISTYLANLLPAFNGSVLVAKDGKVVYASTIGMADITARVPITRETKFRIGSITKTFTAAAVMLLDQQGKVSLTDSVCKYETTCPDAWREITIRNLLTHTSGIPDYLRPLTLGEFNRPTPPERLVDLIRDQPLAFRPGTQFQYSNTNYILLGLAVEHASGQSWDAFVRDKMLDPLALANTGYQRDFSSVPGHATGYGFKTTDVSETVPTDEAAFSDGGLYSTVDDLYQWDRSLDMNKILSKSTLDQMFRPWGGLGLNPVPGQQTPGYGWYLEHQGGVGQIVYHGGSIPGFAAADYRYIDQGLIVIVLSNYYWSPAEKIARAISNLARG